MMLKWLDLSRETDACGIWPGTKCPSATQNPLSFQYIIKILETMILLNFIIALW